MSRKTLAAGLASGEEIPCFALTSPEAGSDAGAIPDTGIICTGEWQGEQVLGMRLNWNKRYITRHRSPQYWVSPLNCMTGQTAR